MSEVKVGADAPKPRGRPPKNGSTTAVKKAAPKKIEEVKTYTIMNDRDLASLPKIYKCSHCGKLSLNPLNKFYRNQTVTAFTGNDGYTHVCIDCVQTLLDKYTQEYGDEKLATFLVCLNTGHYFNELLYETMTANGEPVQFGKYLRMTNNPQWGHGKTILDNFAELYDARVLFMSANEIQKKMEGNWKIEDRKNMTSCIRLLGYDPFSDDVYTSNDRKFLFNTLSRYLADETLINDPHKLVSVVEIVKMQLQVTMLQARTVGILRAAAPDNSLYKTLAETMSRLNDTINKTAKANSITSDSRSAKSAKTFTGTIDEMLRSGMLEAKTNVANVKMDEAYRNIADISHRALMAELNYTSDEYAKMVAEQADRIRDKDAKIVQLEEELRKTRVELEIMKNPKKYNRTPFEGNEVYFTVQDDDMSQEPDVEQILNELRNENGGE